MARQVCTSDSLMPENHTGKWEHPEATHIGTESCFQTGQEFDKYNCPACGIDFKVEVAQ